jgi:hypothetical protein
VGSYQLWGCRAKVSLAVRKEAKYQSNKSIDEPSKDVDIADIDIRCNKPPCRRKIHKLLLA